MFLSQQVNGKFKNKKSLNKARSMKDNMRKIMDNLQNQLKVKSFQRQESEKEKTLWLEKYKEQSIH